MEAEAGASAVPTGPSASGDGVGTFEGGLPEPSQEVNSTGSHIPTFPTAVRGSCTTTAADDLGFEWQKRAAVREDESSLARDLRRPSQCYR